MHRDFDDTYPTAPAPLMDRRGPRRTRPKPSPLLIALALVWFVGLVVILSTL